MYELMQRYILIAILSFIIPCEAFSASIAIIKTKNLELYNEVITAFKTNCVARFTEYDMEDKDSRGELIANKINNDKPDIVFVVGTKAAVIAKKFITNIPVIFAMVMNPENYDVSGKNVTGISMVIPVYTQLYTLKSIVPKISKVGVIYNPKQTGKMIEEALNVSRQLGFNLVAAKVDSKEDVSRALRAFSEGIDAFWMLPDPTVWSKESFDTVLKFTLEKRVPFLAFSKSMVQAGALVSLAINYSELGKQACSVATKLMQSGPPKEYQLLPPKGLELTFNMNTAKLLGFQDIATNAVGFAASEGYKISVEQ
jgi:putative ABC transport system substrate-binding protein